MANEYAINYEDDRFKQVESEKQNAINQNDSLYGSLVNESEKYYQAQIDASKNWADTQSQLQQEKTDFAIEQIEQQKEQAQKDYTKEQSGAYVDWQKQSNQYGVRAEQMADKGLMNTGYSESAQVSMYNTYQSRMATAREAYNNAVLNYNNSIKDAQLQNNSALAEIAYQALQQQLELSLQGFQYKNNLLLEQANKKLEIENQYYNRYQDVLDQINKENSLAEQVRQYNESLALEREQFEWQKAQASRSYGGGGSYYSDGGSDDGAKLIQDDSSDAFKSGQPLLKGAANAKTYLKNTLNSIVNSSDFKASKISNINAAVSVAINNGTVSSSEGAALIQSYSRQVK